MSASTLERVMDRLAAAARASRQPLPRLLAVSKFHPADSLLPLIDAGQRAFGENYVREAIAKQAALAALPAATQAARLEWHLIGHLQSNKARDAAQAFDWVQTVDRIKLIRALAEARPDDRAPLNVLVQVNIDDESSKHGCAPQEVDALADAILAQPRLRLRGLMAIPAPHPDDALRRAAFVRMKALFDRLAARGPGIDTLSMGMSDDLELAVNEGSTMVRVGTALFGPRPAPPAASRA